MKTAFGTHDPTSYILNRQLWQHRKTKLDKWEIHLGSTACAGAFVEHQHLFNGTTYLLVEVVMNFFFVGFWASCFLRKAQSVLCVRTVFIFYFLLTLFVFWLKVVGNGVFVCERCLVLVDWQKWLFWIKNVGFVCNCWEMSLKVILMCDIWWVVNVCFG